MTAINYSCTGVPLVLSPPKRVSQTPSRIEKLQKDIAHQRETLEKANRDLTFCHISLKHWSWISTCFGGLAFCSPFTKIVYEITALYDSNCSNSAATIGIGTTAGVLAIGYLGTKTIVGCINKKKKRIITPIDDQLKELYSLERLFKLMADLSNEKDPEINKEELLTSCAQEMQSQKGNWLNEESKQQWFYILAQKLPESSEIKALIRKASEIAEKIHQTETKSSSSTDKDDEKNPVDIELGLLRDVGEGSSSEDEVDSQLGVRINNKRFSRAAIIDVEAQNEETSDTEDLSSSDSDFLDEKAADSIAAPASPRPSTRPIDEKTRAKRIKLKKITQKLNKRLGLKEFYTGKLYYDIYGNIKSAS